MPNPRRESDTGGDKENRPAFFELEKISRKSREGGFQKMRKECFDFGFTLDRAKYGYFLSGHDLPAAGVQCRELEEVCEELLNYGIELPPRSTPSDE